jgi:hypothetical protein
MSGGDRNHLRAEPAGGATTGQNQKKKFQKPLDKPHRVWYTKYVPKGTTKE